MTVDLQPLITSLVGLAALAITTIGTLAVKRIADYVGIKISDQKMKLLDSVLSKAVASGAMQANDIIAAKGWDHPEVHNAVIAKAMNYAIEKFPDALTMAGLDPTDPATAGHLESALQRILPTAIAPVAASPATPAA